MSWFSGVTDAVSNAASAVGDTFMAVADAGAEAAAWAAETAADAAVAAAESAAEAAAWAAEKATDAAKAATDSAVEAAAWTAQKAKEAADATVDAAKYAAWKGVGAAVWTAQKTIEAADATVEAAIWTAQKAKEAVDATVNAAKYVVGKGVDAAVWTAQKAKEAADATVYAAKYAARKGVDAAKWTAKKTRQIATTTGNAAVAVYYKAKDLFNKAVAVTATVVCAAKAITEELMMAAGMAGVAVGSAAYSELMEPYFKVKDQFFPDNSPKKFTPQIYPHQQVDIFNNTYRKSLIDSHFRGEGIEALRNAMNELAKPYPPDNLDEVLQNIATARNRPIEEITAEYAKFVEKRNEVNKRIGDNNSEIPPNKRLDPIVDLESKQKKEFMGSVWQLRYGKVIGDKLGVDPVFGALLNPSGGMVGPGIDGIAVKGVTLKSGAPDKWPEAVAYHGAYHDAMGYLFNYHGEGKGYNYMKSPIGLDSSNPLAGQSSGISQWIVNLTRKY